MSLKKLIAILTVLVMSVFVPNPATAAPKSPVTLTYKGATAVPFGSKDFQFGRNQQGAFIATWLVETATNRWQIWQGDYNPYEGVLINQTLTYQLPAGTTFLSKPVMSKGVNTLGLAYSTYWETETEVKSEVEAISLGSEGDSDRQVVTTLPTITILKSSDDYVNGCQIAGNRCGYKKVAIGGNFQHQMTIAALEFTGSSNARIGLTSTVYLRSAYWTDPLWISAGQQNSFDTQDAFLSDGYDGAFFFYIDQSDGGRAKWVKISTANNPNYPLPNEPAIIQSVSNPSTIEAAANLSVIKVTRLNTNHSVLTFATDAYRNLQIWRAEVSTQFDNVGIPLVAFSAASRDLTSSGYSVNRVTDNSFEIVVKSVDSRLPDYWRLDRVTTNIFDFDSDTINIAKGIDQDLSSVTGTSYESQNSGYVMAVGTTKADGTLGQTGVYRSDFGIVPVPVKTKGGSVIQQTLMHDDFEGNTFNVNLVVKGTSEFAEITKIVVKSKPMLFLYSHTYSAQPVGTAISYTLTDWTSATYVQGSSTQWLRCTKRVLAVTIGLPKTCKRIVGETNSAYTIQGADVGKYLTVQLSATNRWGTSSYIIPSTKVVK